MVNCHITKSHSRSKLWVLAQSALSDPRYYCPTQLNASSAGSVLLLLLVTIYTCHIQSTSCWPTRGHIINVSKDEAEAHMSQLSSNNAVGSEKSYGYISTSHVHVDTKTFRRMCIAQTDQRYSEIEPSESTASIAMRRG